MTQDTFIQLCEQLSNHVWLQGLLVIVGCILFEDAARCGVGLLVADEQLGWWVALVSMTLGGVVGDVVLYVIGRSSISFLIRRRWVNAERLAWAEGCFTRHAIKAIVIARFIPGVRMITYLAAGTARYPAARFVFWLSLAAAVQAFLFLKASDVIGQTLLSYLHDKRLRLIVVGVIVLTLIAANAYYLIRRARKNKLAAQKEKATDVN